MCCEVVIVSFRVLRLIKHEASNCISVMNLHKLLNIPWTAPQTKQLAKQVRLIVFLDVMNMWNINCPLLS